jgi:2-oxo-4-hydroxy-4-carboxy-5-ureidoimidazoline decarboxylase
MVLQRPFKDKAAVLVAADEAWAKTNESDWLEAFASHPRIGGASTNAWAKSEQSSVASADKAVLDALVQGNADYEAKFGHIFIVCATGKHAAAMLDLLKSRLGNDPKTEKRIAAAEQAKITKIRLEKLLS